ncbi:hypothetical protein CDD83_2749 [Cordyceps sp. RAO-2017]|nr:hypothetical protein CDD83_2749 [Cordyceps sp. RAO-2017]
MIGVTLGGGVGRLQGTHGLLLDALVSVRLVTAKGKLVEASASSNPDLFWAIRGAGANFGVVTSATYKLHPLINGGSILNADLYYPANKSLAYFKAVEAFGDNLPPRLASITFATWNSSINSIQVAANWVYYGPRAEGLKLLQPLLDLKPTAAVISDVRYNRLAATAGDNFDAIVCQPKAIRSLYGINQKKYSAAAYQRAFDKMAGFFRDHPGGRNSALSFEFFPNQASGAVPADETAYPWRDATGYLVPNFSWDAGDDATATAAGKLGLELRQELARTSGYDGITVFVNYARGDEGVENIYGRDKLPRLVRLKKAWDPDNVFAYYHPLPTDYS